MPEMTIKFSAVANLVKVLQRPLTVFDFETTTFRGRDNFAITEVACFTITVAGRGVIYSHLINPERSIDPRVAELTGISQSMVRNKELWSNRYARHFQDLATNHWVCGFNIKTFDCPAAVEMGERYGFPIDNGFPRMLDVRNLYLALEKPESKRGKLVEIAELYGVAPQGSLHRAEADVILTLETLNAMVDHYGVEDIVAVLMPTPRPALSTAQTVLGVPFATVPVTATPLPYPALAAGATVTNAIVAAVATGSIKTIESLAQTIGLEPRTASLELGKAIDARKVNPLPFVNEATLDWLRAMLGEVPATTLEQGHLKPIYAYLSERQPEAITLDYLQLRIGLLDCGLNWSTLQPASSA